MDILCVGMYRACSTWQYEVISHLLERYRDGERLGYVAGEEYAALDRSSGRSERWCVLKSHEGDRSFEAAVAEGRALAVYSHRDIRDVVFSLMHKRGQTFSTMVRQGMIHQILVNDRFWRRQPRLLVQPYEALIADPVAGVEQIAAFLGIELAGGEAAEIAAEYSFQTNRKRVAELSERLRAAGVDLSDPMNFQRYDDRTLLHWNHMREGRAGHWRSQATSAERAFLARLCDRWLLAHGYDATPRTTLPNRSLAGRVLDALRLEWDLGRSWLACRLRCLSLRYPKTSRSVKRLLGISTAPPPAAPVALSQLRVDPGTSEKGPWAQPTREGASARLVSRDGQ